MKQAGCNMSNTQSYVRASVALLMGIIFIQFELWYFLPLSIILFYTAYQKYCLMFTIFGINKKLRVENYYHALLPKYSPYASCIFNDIGELVYLNHSAKKIFNKVSNSSEFGILDTKVHIDSNNKMDNIFEHNNQTYQLHVRGIKEEQILLVYLNDITDVLALESTNLHLSDKVEDALIENDHKNHLLAQQSKFATTGELIENITHQMKQPLATLSGVLLNVQCAQPHTEESLNREIEKASALIQIMSQTVDDFKNFFKVDKEQEVFSIDRCMKDVMLILSSSLHKESIEVINNVNPTVQVKGFKNEFTQVLLNIISNAKDAFNDNPSLTKSIQIQTLFNNNTVSLEITDTAGGIPTEHLHKIFDSHYTTKGDREGTGIGLHMSQIIIEKDMFGSIKAENHNNGARFIIELPAQIAI